MRALMLFALFAGCSDRECVSGDYYFYFDDGFLARSSEGGFTDIYKGDCGIRDGVAVCGDLAHWLAGTEVRQVGQMSECVLDGAGAVRCDPANIGAPQTLTGPFERFDENDRLLCGLGEGRLQCEVPNWLVLHDSPDEDPYVLSTPAPFATDRTWVDVSAGSAEMCAIDDAGRVTCVGGALQPYDLPGRWSGLLGGCAVGSRGQLHCDADGIGNPGGPVEYLPCRGVTYVATNGGWCFETDTGATTCYDHDYDDVYEQGPRPSLEARKIRGKVRCGLEPGGFIVCGDPAESYEEENYFSKINLP